MRYLLETTSNQSNRLKVTPRQVCFWSALLGLSVATIGCSETSSSGASGEGEQASDPQVEVVTTFAPITSFAKAVAGDRAQVTQLLPSGVSPHDYQARPEEIVRLQNAEVVIENGLEFEPFLENMIEASENSDVVVIDSSEGIEVVDIEEDAHAEHDGHEGHGHDDHGHEEHGHDDHGHDDDKAKAKGDKADKHAGHAHGEHDPHIWLDPKRAIQQVENIRDGLIAVDPEGTDVYQANAQAYIEELQALDQEITQQLQPYAGKTFVTYHDFANYFANSYGLNAEFLVGVPSENASPEDVTRVIDAVKESNLKTLLTEPQVSNDPFAALADDLDISVSLFDPMGASAVADIEADTYVTTMRSNLKNLSAAFSAQSQQSFWFQPRQSSSKGIAMVPFSLLNAR